MNFEEYNKFRKGFNRNLMGGKRRNKGIGQVMKLKNPHSLSERVLMECQRLKDYQIRVGQHK